MTKTLFLLIFIYLVPSAAAAACDGSDHALYCDESSLPYGDSCFFGFTTVVEVGPTRYVSMEVQEVVGVNGNNIRIGETLEFSVGPDDEYVRGPSATLTTSSLVLCFVQEDLTYIVGANEGIINSSIANVDAQLAMTSYIGETSCRELFQTPVANCNDVQNCSSTGNCQDLVILMIFLFLISLQRGTSKN